jgi:hypothetical protein
MPRPKGSKDKTKRKIKTILNGNQERELIAEYRDGATTSSLLKKYNVSKAYLSNMFKLRDIKTNVDYSEIKQWKTINNIKRMKDNVSGVYAIYFIWKYNKDDIDASFKINNIKLYIGSSINIKKRLTEHYRDLKYNKHCSKLLLSYFKNKDFTIKYAIIEQCAEDDLLTKETSYLNQYNKNCLLNTWTANKEEYLRPWLQKAITYNSYTKFYTINSDTGCKESNDVHVSGYARMQVTIGESKDPGQTKTLLKHRVAYWEKTGEYPELIRHKCGNGRCFNPDHLEKGSHRQNSLDKRGNFPKEFEEKWIEFGADLNKLTQYFADRWSGSQMWCGKKVSYATYKWEKELKLKEKYPDILDSNRNRRFSLSYRKLKTQRKNKKEESNWIV